MWSPPRQYRNASVANSSLDYHLFSPSVSEPGSRLPLLCFLHGIGDITLRPSRLTYFTKPQYQQRLPLFLLRPQAPAPGNWMPGRGPSGIKFKSLGARTHRVRLHAMLIGLLDQLAAELPIDPRRLVLAGVSMGGYAAWDLLVTLPGRFAVVIPRSAAAWTIGRRASSAVRPRSGPSTQPAISSCRCRSLAAW